MSGRNWGLITSGATFESLASTLVFFEDPKAALFGRRGKDGGQDARSGDGRRVFQAKHHQDGKASKALADAKKEAKKIAGYRTPGHARESEWRGVTEWRLVTNAAFNPKDRARWDSEVVPLFDKLGLTADYWEQANLDALLDRHPEVDRAYFKNQTRAFLSLPEVNEALLQREPFLRRDVFNTFVGRRDEIQKVWSFLDSEKLFLVVHGPGGVGKTRMVIEAGEQIVEGGHWTVLWANVASMEANGGWFDAIVPERPTLLIVDEPEDDRVLQLLSEQLGSRLGRTTEWKVVITVRSPKDPVLKFLDGAKMVHRVDKFCVGALPQADAERMCEELIGGGSLSSEPAGWRASTSQELSRRFANHPIWLTLAVHLLETTGELSDVPETAEGLADKYLSEVVAQQSSSSPDRVLGLLRWVALVNTLNREDDAVIELVAGQAELGTVTATRGALASLVKRKALIERGARNRLVEVKPDVLRDHLLLKWLFVDIGYGSNPICPSDDAVTLVNMMLDASQKGSLSVAERSILASLARIEWVLAPSGHMVSLMDPYMAGLKDLVVETTASKRVALAGTLVELAAYRPVDVVEISRILREGSCPTEKVDGLFSSYEVGQYDVRLALAWPVFHAAFGARTGDQQRIVLCELCELVEAEAKASQNLGRNLPNDGKRAKSLVSRIIEGGPQYWSDFDDAVLYVAGRLLDEAAEVPPCLARASLLEALLDPATSLERQQTWSEGFTFHLRTVTLTPDHSGWQTRAELREKMIKLLENEQTPRGTRLVLWQLISRSHNNANRGAMRADDRLKGLLREEMLGDLIWARSVLSPRAGDLEELLAARSLWDWHHRFDEDSELRLVADELEALYSGNELAREFKPLLKWDDVEARTLRVEEKAHELSEAGSDAIDAFIARAREFLRSDQQIHRVFHVAWQLGVMADTSESVQGFIFDMLESAPGLPRSDFGMHVVAGWVFTKRSQEPQSVHELVTKLFDSCSDDSLRVNLLKRLYERPYVLSEEEFLFIRSQHSMFLQADSALLYITCVGWGVDFQWQELKMLIEQVLDELLDGQITAAVDVLSKTLLSALYDGSERAMQVPEDLGGWFLNQLLRVPDLSNLGETIEWRIQEIIQRVGRVPLEWLPDALACRQSLENQTSTVKFRAIGHRVRLSNYVIPIASKNEMSQEEVAVIRRILDFVDDTGSIGYHLYQILQDIDPHGCVVPEEVVHRISGMSETSDVWKLARVAGAFPVGSLPWRKIAKPVLERTMLIHPGDRDGLYFALGGEGIKSWSTAPGEVPAIFIEDVKSARRLLEDESESNFVSFWQWRLDAAEAALRDQEERAKEDRGE